MRPDIVDLHLEMRKQAFETLALPLLKALIEKRNKNA